MMVVNRVLRVLLLCFVIVPVLLFAAGCYEKLNGGGWMESANGVDKANFSISYNLTPYLESDQSDPSLIHLEGIYHDKGLDVRLKYEDVLDFADEPDVSEGEDCVLFLTTYTSQDSATRPDNTGEAEVLACDLGEPGVEGDFLLINILTGPYEGYSNAGPILGGNFQGFQLEGQ
jgi:hypothetical protein